MKDREAKSRDKQERDRLVSRLFSILRFSLGFSFLS